MKSVTRLMLFLCPLIFLVGCASTPSFSKRDKQYLYARSIPPLKVPPGISSNAFESYYPVSNRQYPLAEEDVSIEPPGLTAK